MTYNVFGGTLNLALPTHKVQSPTSRHQQPHTGSDRTQMTSASLMPCHASQTCAEADGDEVIDCINTIH